MSGVGGEFGEKEELLSTLKEDRDAVAADKNVKKNASTKREKEKGRLCAIIRERAIARISKAQSDEDDEDSNEPSESPNGGKPVGRKGRVRKKNQAIVLNKEAGFIATLKSSDEKWFQLEEKKLELARLELEKRREDRKREREDSVVDRDAAAELELKKTKLMADAFATALMAFGGSDEAGPSKLLQGPRYARDGTSTPDLGSERNQDSLRAWVFL